MTPYLLAALAVAAALAAALWLMRRRRPGSDWIEAEALQQQIAGGAGPTVLDVRGADEFAGPLGHIPGAMNVPLAALDGRLDALRGARPPLAVVCRTDKRSALAQATLRAAGFERVTVLRGGMERWNALGFETVRARPAGEPTTGKETTR